MKQYSVYQTSNEGREANFQFHRSNKLPHNYPISTPFTFAFIGEDVVLCLDKNNWWNPLGGHIEVNEDYKDTLVRESQEEAGINISKSSIKAVGYILNTNNGKVTTAKYPAVNLLPITRSFVTEINTNWIQMETKDRAIYRRRRALELMRERDDSNQMYEILESVYEDFDKQKYAVSYKYFPRRIFKSVPVTQVFTFCLNTDNKICVVRDEGESFFSLPGGSCELNETPEECIARELNEEAQMTCKDLSLLGTILVEFKKGNKTVSKFQQLRYMAKVDAIETFIPYKNEFETIERQFLDVSQLGTKVKILQNNNGETILKQVSELV